MAYDRAEYIKNQNMQKENLEQQIKQLAESYKDDPKVFAELLSFNSKFYQYSPKNNTLIYMQNPHASFTDNFMGFKNNGYNVKKGEHGLKIFVPVKVTYLYDTNANEWIKLSDAPKTLKDKYKNNQIQSKTVQRFKIGTVFDISQTDCPAEDYPKYFNVGYKDKTQAQIYNAIKEYSKDNLHCPVEEIDMKSISLKGQFIPPENKININMLLKDSEKLSTLMHELGHAILHNEFHIDGGKKTEQKEFEADALSIMIASHFGIELTEHRMRHLSAHFHKYNELLSEQNESTDKGNSLESVDKVLENVGNKFKEIIGELSKVVKEYASDQQLNKDEQNDEKINIITYAGYEALDPVLIRRANEASLSDMGDIINREYIKSIELVDRLELPTHTKMKAFSELRVMYSKELILQSKVVNPYVSGVARLTSEQQSGKYVDSVADQNAKIRSYIYSLQHQSEKNKISAKNERIVTAIREADSKGEKQVTVEGVTYYKARKNWSTKPSANNAAQNTAEGAKENIDNSLAHSESIEKSFAEQVDEALQVGNENQFNALKVCDTPQILLDVGCRQLPMLYTQKHLREAVQLKSKDNVHWHGLTTKQIKELPNLLKSPVMIFDSLKMVEMLKLLQSDILVAIKSCRQIGELTDIFAFNLNFANNNYNGEDEYVYYKKGIPKEILQIVL